LIVLGQHVRDRVTGFRGVVVARIEHLYQSPEVRVQPQSVADNGQPAEATWLNEAQVESVETNHIPHFETHLRAADYRAPSSFNPEDAQ
jgi:heat shock protein HspQ